MIFNNDDLTEIKMFKKRLRKLVLKILMSFFIGKKSIIENDKYRLDESKVKEANLEIYSLLENKGFKNNDYKIVYSYGIDEGEGRTHVKLEDRRIYISYRQLAMDSIMFNIEVLELYKITLLHEIGHILGDSSRNVYENEYLAWNFAKYIYPQCKLCVIKYYLYSYYPLRKKLKNIFNLH